MNLIMKDYVTPQERLSYYADGSPYFEECCGCGRTSDEIMQEYECTPDDLDDNSVTTDSGLWYCHRDCFRDSQ